MSNAYIKTLKDGNGNIVYPQTKTGAIYRNDNSASLDSLLDAAVYMNAEEEGVTPVTRDADTLGGYPASDYVKSVNSALPDENGNVDIESEFYMINFAYNSTTGRITADKTESEILNAYKNNKKIMATQHNVSTGDNIYYLTFFEIGDSTVSGPVIRKCIFISMSDDGAKYLTCVKQNEYLVVLTTYSLKSTISTRTLLASGWSDNTYDLGNTDYNLEIELDSSATDEMIEAWTNAKILGSATSNILTAKGDVPTIDITCIMKRTVK